jgi:hypothetical protein
MIVTLRADNIRQACAVKSACITHAVEFDEYHERDDADWAFDLYGRLDKIEAVAARSGAVIVNYMEQSC